MEEEDYTVCFEEEERCPEWIFEHAESGVDSGIREGMIVEMGLRGRRMEEEEEEDEDGGGGGGFWLGRIEKVFGPLLKLIYVGKRTEGLGDDESEEFWTDVSGGKLFPLGYCQMNKLEMRPPPEVEAHLPDWEKTALKYLEDVKYETIPMHHILEGGGITPAERLKPGMVLDVRDRERPKVFWSAVIRENKGGILHLEYDLPEDEEEEGNERSFLRICYLSPRLIRCNFKDRKGNFEPPSQIHRLFPHVNWKDFRTKLGSLDRPLPPEDLIRSKIPASPADASNHFDEETLVEIVHPLTRKTLELGVVDLVENDGYFVVRLFTDESVKAVCTSSDVFPVGWSRGTEFESCRSSSLASKLPGNYSLALKKCFSKTQSSEFKVGHILEVLYEDSMYVGKIITAKDSLLKIEIEESNSKNLLLIPSNDYNLFPFGWSFSNAVPINISSSRLKVQSHVTEDTTKIKEAAKPTVSSSWCDAIYINCKCSSAGFLSKKRLLSLPKSVGPGPVRLVMRAILSKLIGSSFKSGSVLKRLEYDESRPPRKNFYLETLKGKSRVLNLKARVEIPSLAEDVDAYCREVCCKVGACPYLISTKLYENECPASCKNGEGNVVGRPRKRRFPPTFQTNNGSGNSNSNTPNNEDSSLSSLEETDDNVSRNNSRSVSPAIVESRKRHCRREWSELLPKSDIQTRGAKLPDWKLHLKIRPSKREQKVIENNQIRESIGYDSLGNKRHNIKGLEPAFKISDIPTQDLIPDSSSSMSEEDSSEGISETKGNRTSLSPPPIRIIRLRSDPSSWTPFETARFLAQTLDCSHLARFMYEDQIDGPAFLLLNFPTVKEYWSLKTDTAIKLCQHVESVKLAYFNKLYD